MNGDSNRAGSSRGRRGETDLSTSVPRLSTVNNQLPQLAASRCKLPDEASAPTVGSPDRGKQLSQARPVAELSGTVGGRTGPSALECLYIQNPRRG